MENVQTNFLGSLMEISALKRKTIADNIANYNTPNFKGTKVVFEDMFNGSDGKLKQTNEKHITGFSGSDEPKLVTDTTTKERYDGNNVDLNEEMIDMVKNNYMYNMSVQALNKQFALTKIARGQG